MYFYVQETCLSRIGFWSGCCENKDAWIIVALACKVILLINVIIILFLLFIYYNIYIYKY